MKPSNHYHKRPLYLLVSAGFFLIVFLLLSIIAVAHQNPYGASIKISGLNNISGLPRNEKDLLESELYRLVQANLSSDSFAIPTSGASVVKSTITYSSDNSVDDKNYRSARFLVELKSLKLIYVATVEWTSSRNKSSLSGYPVALTCPTLVSENFYPETPCTDFLSTDLGSSLPLLRYLPYRTNDFILTPVDLSAERPKLLATLLIHSYQTSSEQIDEKSAELKQAIETYIKSVGASPEDYDLSYKIEYGD